MINAITFCTDTLNTVDAVIGNFVQSVYQNFVQSHSTLITMLFTVYVMVLGYRIMNHTHHFNFSTILRHLILMLCVYGLVMDWYLYDLFVYNIFTNEPGYIAQVLIKSGNHFSHESIAKALDQIYASILHATMELFGQISFSSGGFAFFFYGVLVFLIGTAMCIFALLLFVYAKMMMAIGLALGPIFILFILWEPTKGIFSAWFNLLVTIAFIPVVTSAILVLMLSVINTTLPQINQPIDNLQFYGIAPFLGLSLTTALLLSQVFRICSALGGGLTLSSISAGVGIAQAALNKTGLTYAAQQSRQWAQKKLNKNQRKNFTKDFKG